MTCPEKVNRYVTRTVTPGSAEENLTILVRTAIALGVEHSKDIHFDKASESYAMARLAGFVSATSQATNRELDVDDIWAAIDAAVKEATS